MTLKVNNGKVNCILISGKAGVGKDTVADLMSNYLGQLDENVSIRHFAHALKGAAVRYFNWDMVKDVEGRKLLQSLGDVGRNYIKDLWVLHTKHSFERSEVFLPRFLIIPDWRYLNELDCFISDPLYNVITVRVEGNELSDLGELSKHASETELPSVDFSTVGADSPYDYVISNNSAGNDTAYAVSEMMMSIME